MTTQYTIYMIKPLYDGTVDRLGPVKYCLSTVKDNTRLSEEEAEKRLAELRLIEEYKHRRFTIIKEYV